MGPRSNKKGKHSVKASSLKRPAPFRLVRKSVLIVCEDSKSSPDYFKKFRSKLRLTSVDVEICGKECGNAPISVVDYAKEKKLKIDTSPIRDYDEIFCVVDVDDHPSLGDAIQKARDNDLEIIISNPCFEYWYILHFEKIGRSYSSRNRLYSHLNTHLKNHGCEYSKGGCDFFDIVHPRTEFAVNNSKEILRSQWPDEEDLRKCNPSTDVHRVVECLNTIRD